MECALLRLRFFTAVISLLLFCWTDVRGQTLSPELAKPFEKRIGSYGLRGTPSFKRSAKPGDNSSLVTANYAGTGNQVEVKVLTFNQDADAYSNLSIEAELARKDNPNLNIDSQVGTASFVSSEKVAFFKGRHFVKVLPESGEPDSSVIEFARAFAEKLDKGEGEVPVLIKHLPAWEEAQKRAVFISHYDKAFPEYPAVTAIESQKDADAVLAWYGQSKLLLVEFHTPQLASENDQRIIAKIRELWKAGERAPTAYRRVGNYSVFVFDAPDEQTAKRLIDQVKYEQVVQWLGENPYILKEAQRQYAETTLGVFVAVIKASGFALLGCLATGALIGAWLFNRRRLQQRNLDAFSDAGGMLRLNIDELTPQTNTTRLLRERN
jgi:hypothetical protein